MAGLVLGNVSLQGRINPSHSWSDVAGIGSGGGKSGNRSVAAFHRSERVLR